jgi:hypothetical protein
MRDYDENYEWWQETRDMVVEQAKYYVDEWIDKNASDGESLVYLFQTQGLEMSDLAMILAENTTKEARAKVLKADYEKEVEEFLICSDAFHKKMEDMRMGHYDL